MSRPDGSWAGTWSSLAGRRQSLGAGFCGAIASLGWFTALAYAPAGPVRAGRDIFERMRVSITEYDQFVLKSFMK